MNSICIIIPYFGSWPPWFQLFLESCRWNPTIDWILFTDCQIPRKTPKNVFFEQIQLKDFAEVLETELELPGLTIQHPYKLCDFKPMFGKAFQQKISKYDFWGHGDIDVIYGDLRSLFTTEVLNYKIISTHRRHLSGHLALYRNLDEVNSLYQKVPRWKALALDKSNQKFDEIHFMKAFELSYFEKNVHKRDWDGTPIGCEKGFYFREHWSTPRFYLNLPFSFRRIRWRGLSKNKLWRGQSRIPDKWFWQSGCLWNNVDSDGNPYLHFMHWAREDWKLLPTVLRSDLGDMLAKGFRIERTGFYGIDDPGPALSERALHWLKYLVLRIKTRTQTYVKKTKQRLDKFLEKKFAH